MAVKFDHIQPLNHLQIMDCFASTHQGSYRCPYCLMEGLTEDGLHAHFPLYHVAEPNVPVTW